MLGVPLQVPDVFKDGFMSDINTLDAELGFTAESEIVEMYKAKGRAIEISEIRDRLSLSLFEQLKDGSAQTILKAINRALIHANAVLGKSGDSLDLDNVVHREVVLNLTLYELHMAVGHEEAGREYRLKARDLLNSAIGDEPGNNSDVPVGAVVCPPKNSRWF